METLEIVLTEHPCFKGLEAKYFKTMLSCAAPAKFDPDKIIAREGDPANEFYLIRQGIVGLEISVPNQGIVTIETVSAGELLGWSWMVPPYKCHFTARAHSSILAIAIDGRRLREIISKDHELGYQLYGCFIDLIVHRLQATRLQLLDVYNVRV
ncbi:cyclic nucleotide-binding domain-containing protein [bacterium]|nr:cyclic nucleotide-binding domain-containing protein [FCB group bacterium]MBL7191624.1 cyclic nucleotide-binding domain-containing protein [bacterium]